MNIWKDNEQINKKHFYSRQKGRVHSMIVDSREIYKVNRKRKREYTLCEASKEEKNRRRKKQKKRSKSMNDERSYDNDGRRKENDQEEFEEELRRRRIKKAMNNNGDKCRKINKKENEWINDKNSYINQNFVNNNQYN